MKTRAHHPWYSQTGFTLVEMLTALAVLSLLVVLIAQLFTSASTITRASTVRLDADTEARVVFDRMSQDFTWMLRRPDVDFHFVKQADSGVAPANAPYSDTCLFFSEVPGYYNDATVPESNMALVGYRINSATYQLERLAWGLPWDSDTTSGSSIVYLSYNNFGSTTLTDYTPASTSTILGAFPETPGLDQAGYNTSDNSTAPGANFHVLADAVFRMEFCFFLKDGTYSVVPAINYVPTTGTAANNLSASTPPSPTSTGYSAGSRWYDTTNNHGYICTNATSGAEVWKPLGMTDVQAVVVTLAVLDQTSQKFLGTTPATTALPNLAKALYGPTWTASTGTLSGAVASTGTPATYVLPATLWQNAINSSTFATTTGVPKAAASQVRVYQRFFYLENNNL